METPFDILGVSEDASDEVIKKAYLHKVRQYPPERYPDQFQRIRRAFEAIHTQSLRLRYQLFHREPPRLTTLITCNVHRDDRAIKRPSADCFMKTLAESFNRKRDQ